MRSKIEQLERACYGQEFMMYQDMGVANGYFLAPKIAPMVMDIAACPEALSIIDDSYVRGSRDRILGPSIEFVFPMLDILMRYEVATGLPTDQVRERLWECWKAALKAKPETTYCTVKYGMDRRTYENDIRSKWGRTGGENK